MTTNNIKTKPTKAAVMAEDNAGGICIAYLDAGKPVYLYHDADRAAQRDMWAQIVAGNDPIAEAWEGYTGDEAAARYDDIESCLDMYGFRGGAWREVVATWNDVVGQIVYVDCHTCISK